MTIKLFPELVADTAELFSRFYHAFIVVGILKVVFAGKNESVFIIINSATALFDFADCGRTSPGLAVGTAGVTSADILYFLSENDFGGVYISVLENFQSIYIKHI